MTILDFREVLLILKVIGLDRVRDNCLIPAVVAVAALVVNLDPSNARQVMRGIEYSWWCDEGP